MRPVLSRDAAAYSSLLLLFTAFCIALPALAEDTGDGGNDGGAGGHAETQPAPSDPRTPHVQALIDGALDIGIEPQSLFDVSLGDEVALQIERVRVQTLLDSIEARERPAPSASQPSKPPRKPEPPSLPPPAPIETVDPGLWQARLELDRVRLAFYKLSPERRAELLHDHEKRREAAKPRETEEEKRLREAEAERQRALQAAKAARSEALRLVNEELARLISLEKRVELARGRFSEQQAELNTRRDALLGWQRRVRDARTGAPGDADALYDALRKSLRASRTDLEKSLDDITAGASDVPSLGPDPLHEIPPDIPTDHARERRAAIERSILKARDEERSLREARASALLDEINGLNLERLGLLPHLSSEKRKGLTNFTLDGWDQAQSEARHLRLVLRYHIHAAAAWISALRMGADLGFSLWKAAGIMLPWTFWLIFFIWWKRRCPGFLRLADKRLTERERAERRVAPSNLRRVLRFIGGIRGPLEWLLFFSGTMWLLPAVAKDLLEVQLLSSIVGWILAGALIVDFIHALAASSPAALFSEADNATAASLRLRSLRLVGRIAVVIILILVVSARLVGEGTIYQWVLSTCWLAALPIFLVLVHWWRGTVFERVSRVRKKSRFQAWILANRTGWKSFIAAMVGAIHLFVTGTIKTIRNWLSSFDIARRIHAYLYKRELKRLVNGNTENLRRSLNHSAFESLSPDTASLDAWIPCPADEAYKQIQRRLQTGHGGIIAIIGGRGIGKSSLLQRLHDEQPGAIYEKCTPLTSPLGLRSSLWPSPTKHRENTPTHHPPPLILLDDIQVLIKPIIGGLSDFDAILSFARSHASATVWVFAIDTILWPFLQRARDARPIFDDVIVLAPWKEEQIGELLWQRSARAGIAPTFDDLLERLPASADEADKQDALRAKEKGYIRMLWDHVRGNPGMALEVWRSSLAEDEDGNVRVRQLQTPDSAVIERLPDVSLFILRAVLQLAPATLTDVVKATHVSEDQVQNAFRFGEAHGYYVEKEGRFGVAWPWLRAVILHLERRHLLVNP